MSDTLSCIKRDDIKSVKIDFRDEDYVNEDIEENSTIIPPMARYKNDLNDVGFYGLSLRESRLYMAVLAGMCNKGQAVQQFKFSELKTIMGESKGLTKKQFSDLIEQTCNNLSKITITATDSRGNWAIFGIFRQFEGDVEKGILTVETAPKFLYIINCLSREYMEVDLKEFNDCRSKSAQTLYRKLSQFRNSNRKECYLTLTDAKKIFELRDDISTKWFNQHILFPAIKEVNKFHKFKYLRLDKEKMRGQRPIHKYFFRWDRPENIAAK